MSNVTNINDAKAVKPKKERKTGSIMLRLSDSERAILEAKRDRAGAKSSAEFIREYVVHSKPVQRMSVEPDVLELIKLFTILSGTILSDIAEGNQKEAMRNVFMSIQDKILPGIRERQVGTQDDEMEV